MLIKLNDPSDLKISITDSKGNLIHQRNISQSETSLGENVFVLDNINIGYGAFYYSVQLGVKTLSRKVIWSE